MKDLPVLWDEDSLSKLPPGWAPKSVAILKNILSPEFPCLFAASARLSIAIAESMEASELARIRLAMLAYLQHARGLEPRESSRSMLIILFPPDDPPLPEDQYRDRMWRILQYLHDHDTRPWPEDVPMDTSDPYWAFCFDGEPLFVNASTPAHIQRRSRNLGPGLVLAIQMRNGVDYQVDFGKAGNAVRRLIRQRVEAYETATPMRMFGPSGAVTKRDWRIYFLPDRGRKTERSCPLALNKNEPPSRPSAKPEEEAS